MSVHSIDAVMLPSLEPVAFSAATLSADADGYGWRLSASGFGDLFNQLAPVAGVPAQVRITVDEDSFVGTGLGLLAAVLDHFFGLYVHVNSFTQLTIVSARTQEEVLKCPPRNGDKPLV